MFPRLTLLQSTWSVFATKFTENYKDEAISYKFQSNHREADFILTRAACGKHNYLLNDMIQPLGNAYNFRLISSQPEEATNFFITINPFDGYTWAFTLASIIAVTFALIMIDKVYEKWANVSTDEVVHKSK